MTDAEEILAHKGVKPTANRILVLRAMLSAQYPVSLPEMVQTLSTMDKSSIFRVLNIFQQHHVVHTIEDGSGVLKYEVCDGVDECTLSDMHTHFHCEVCHKTYCFKAIRIPAIDLPEGFTMSSVNYMVKGVCSRCAKRPR